MKKTTIAKVLAGIMVAATMLSGCGAKEEKQKIVIAYAPNESTDESADARAGLAEDLEAALGVEVEEIQASDRAGAIPVAMKAPDRDRTQAVYHSLLITSSSNEDINSIEDIKGKTIAFVDPESTSGNLFPTYEIMKAFPEENLTSDDLHTNGKFFEAASYSGKHQAGLQAVVRGDVDVVPISDQILQAEIDNGNVNAEDVKIIHESEAIPAECFVVSKDMDEELSAKFQEFLLQYENEEYFEKVIKVPNARFIEASIEDYQIVIDLNNTLNIEE